MPGAGFLVWRCRMTKKSVLVTGCSTGIGRATASVLREKGFDVVAAARGRDDLEALSKAGFKTVRIENTDQKSVEKGFDEAIRLTDDGRIWGVFCNAGYGQPGAIEDVTVEGMREQLETNVVGTHGLARRACKHMVERGGGRILINSSVLGVVGMKMRGIYVCSKYALEGYADVLAMEMADAGVDVALIEPGPVFTKFRANALAAFKRHVDEKNSRHRDQYEGLKEKLAKDAPVAPFTMTDARCAEIAARAFTDKRPKMRYRATVQTHVFSMLKRVLPSRWLQKLAARG